MFYDVLSVIKPAWNIMSCSCAEKIGITLTYSLCSIIGGSRPQLVLLMGGHSLSLITACSFSSGCSKCEWWTVSQQYPITSDITFFLVPSPVDAPTADVRTFSFVYFFEARGSHHPMPVVSTPPPPPSLSNISHVHVLSPAVAPKTQLKMGSGCSTDFTAAHSASQLQRSVPVTLLCHSHALSR